MNTKFTFIFLFLVGSIVQLSAFPLETMDGCAKQIAHSMKKTKFPKTDAHQNLKKAIMPPKLNSRIVFVDQSANGANDGTSWQNAYTELSEALINISPGDEFWVAKGTYKPGPERTSVFRLNRDKVKLIGGFAGTESQLEDRDRSLIHSINTTILDGDVNGNDDLNIVYNNATKAENNFRILWVFGDSVSVDGLTIRNANANATSGQGRFGGGLSLGEEITDFSIRNCIIKNNIAFWAAGLNLGTFEKASIFIDACIFENNLGTSASAFYIIPDRDQEVSASITNCLFHNNRTTDVPSSTRVGLGASAGWIRSFFSGSIVNATVVNNTFVKNRNEGSFDSNFGSLGLSIGEGQLGDITLANNIFWGNLTNDNQVSTAINGVSDGPLPAGLEVTNSIDEDNFFNFTTTKQISNRNPNLRVDFRLIPVSRAAIDNGRNDALPSSIRYDLAGNPRIGNNTIDIGAFELDPALITNTTTSLVELSVISVYPNPARQRIFITTNQKIRQLNLYNNLGALVASAIDQDHLDLKGLADGAYHLQVIFKNTQKTVKLIKQ